MRRTLALLAFLPAALALPALAQTGPARTTEQLIQSIPDDIDPSIFIGAPLLSNEEKYELTKAPRFQFEATDLLVIEGGDVRETGAWSPGAIAACEASGGEVLPLSAGRSMCFRF